MAEKKGGAMIGGGRLSISGNILHIPANEVDEDGAWILWPQAPDERFIASVNRVGQVSPIIVEQAGAETRLIAGYKRLLALKATSQPVKAVTAEADFAGKCLLYMADNADRQTTPGMRVAALRALQGAGRDSATTQLVDALLGVAPASRERKQLDKWLLLPSHWDESLTAGRVPLEAVEILAVLKPADLDAVEPFFRQLSWSRSNAVNFLVRLWETSQRERESLAALLEKEEFDAVLESGLSPKDAMESLLSKARRLRLPTLTGLEKRFAALAAEAEAGTGWSIRPSQNFEADAVDLSARIGSVEDLHRAMRELEEIDKAGLLQKMLNLTAESAGD